QELLVAEDEIPEIVQVIDVVVRAGGRPRMLGRVDGEARGQFLQERVPGEAPGPVIVDQRWARAVREHAHAHAVLPDGERLLAAHPRPAPPAGTAAGTASRSPAGHQ